jgi:hypothetical protein
MNLKLSFALALVISSAGCSSPPVQKNGSLAQAGDQSPGAPAASFAPALLGSWYAGRGGTSIPYDSQTGEFGAPSGDGLMFVFRADGSYTKATQSVVSNADCTTGFMAFEDGTASTDGDQLELHPTRGHLEYFGCTGSDTDKPIAVSDENLSWSLAPSSADGSQMALTLVSQSDGSSSEFRKVE